MPDSKTGLPGEVAGRLADIETQWTMLFKAHNASGDARVHAQKLLLLRYYGAAYRYLLGTVRDPQVAEELTQDFAVRFLRGDFRRVDSGKGRFRDFLKTALRHLAHDYWRKQEKAATPLPQNRSEQTPAASTSDAEFDREFLDKWREELLSRTWAGLGQIEANTQQPYLAVLQRKITQPELRSAQLAEELGRQTGKRFTATSVRQLLHRARETFADLLVDEVAASLQTSALDQLEQELIDLDLLCYCQAALERRKKA
jgi:DNA-directed RNA polymerase specialized sigma24 family protein